MTDSAMQHLQRAQMLLRTDRIDEAEKTLHKVLTQLPELAYAHGLLALCLSRRSKHQDAAKEIKTAISLDPDSGLYYYFFAEILVRAKKYDNAKAAIRRAITMDPDDADYYYLKAVIELEAQERNAAHASLKHALEIDPNHDDSLTLLARLQAMLGKTDDAEELAQTAVQNRPESSDAHTSRGYSLLFAGRAKESFDSFREALRLDPNNEAARSGLIEALKIHNPFYRMLFGFFVMMSRLSARYQWGLIIGLLVGYNVLRNLLRQVPALAPVIVPLLVLYVLFCFVTWVADPIIYTTLWFSRWGRLAMTLREKLVGVVTVLLGVGCIVCLVGFWYWDSGLLFALAGGLALLFLPVTRAINSDHVPDIIVSVTFSVLIALFMIISLVTARFQLVVFALFSLFAYMLISNYLAINRSASRD